MPFALSPEQTAMRDMALAFAREQLAPHALDWDRNRHCPLDVLRAAAQLGLAAVTTSPEHGGSGLTRRDAVLVYEALATGCPAVAAWLSIHNMCCGMIDRFGSGEQRARLLPGLSRMDQLAAYCLTEPGAGSDAAALSTKARREGEHYVLDGQKQFISGAGEAHLYVVMARTGAPGAGGISAFVVPRDTPGLSFGANERKMGWNAQPTRAVMFDAARVPAANLLGAEGMGFKIAMAGLDGGRLSIAACSLGGAQAAMDKALAYTRERKAFGKTIDAFQATQFALADMATELEAARLLLWRAAAALDGKEPEATKLCAMAKRLCTDTGFAVANRALQLLGGYGYLADYGIEKIVRDLRVHQILEGTNEIMRVIIARELLAR